MRDAEGVADVNFGRAEPGTVGVEEEFFLVRPETYEPAPVFTSLFAGSDPQFKPELFECLVETTTPVLGSAGEVLGELDRLRREAAARAEAGGVLLYAAGSHPFARGVGQKIVPARRYQAMLGRLGWRLYRQLICGLHIHISMPSADVCLVAFESVVPWLPLLLALSANSPFADGRDTGRRSVRADRLLNMPTGGTPPVLRDWDDWKAAPDRHFDAWPRPEYGTLEVRVMDMQTDVRRSAGFAAIVRALLAVSDTAGAVSDTLPYDRALYTRRREEASRLPPDPGELERLAAVVEPALSGEELELARLVLGGRPEAERQLEVGITEAARDVAARTLT